MQNLMSAACVCLIGISQHYGFFSGINREINTSAKHMPKFFLQDWLTWWKKPKDLDHYNDGIFSVISHNVSGYYLTPKFRPIYYFLCLITFITYVQQCGHATQNYIAFRRCAILLVIEFSFMKVNYDVTVPVCWRER
jgi:hypothetical protein